MMPTTTVLATLRGSDHSPLAIHSVISSRKKALKRKKMHALKHSRMTFIVRQMVQHVTREKFGDSAVMSETLLGAEPQRAACRGRSSDVVRTSCRNDARSSMAAVFSPAAMLDMRMFPELQQAAVRRFRLPPAVVADGGVGDVVSMFD